MQSIRILSGVSREGKWVFWIPAFAGMAERLGAGYFICMEGGGSPGQSPGAIYFRLCGVRDLLWEV